MNRSALLRVWGRRELLPFLSRGQVRYLIRGLSQRRPDGEQQRHQCDAQGERGDYQDRYLDAAIRSQV